MNNQSNALRMLPFFARRLLLRGLASGLLALPSCGVVAQDAGMALSARYPAGSITTVEAAESAQQQANAERTRIEQQFLQDEQVCNTRFFVNACRDKAKEQRHAALETVGRIQTEAETQLRRLRVVERDQALAEKRQERAAEADRLEQEARQKAQETAQKQARIIENQRAQDAAQRTAAGRQTRQPHPSSVDTAAETQKRAANVAAYHQKIKDAEAHQRDIAIKKAEKDRTRKVPPPSVPPAPPATATPQSKP